VQAAKIDALGLRRLVDVVLYAEEYAPGGKPAAAAFRAVLSRLNLPASSCIAVGDDPLCDVRGGHAAGLATVRVSRPDVEAPVQHEADVVIDRIEELPEVAHALVDLVHSDVA
jgi:putative hydrolase of the HAD superfamily